MTDKIKFENFLFKKWRTLDLEKCMNGDCIISKSFNKHSEELCITARFNKQEDFCGGYLTNDEGQAIVNGKGFTLDEFVRFLEMANI